MFRCNNVTIRLYQGVNTISDQQPPNHLPINPLSIQAASLVRSIDALSTIFWVCFLGFFLSIFFAGLVQLEGNAYTDYIFLGEYQIPKSILPLASLSFAVFTLWLVSNRLNMLSHVIVSTSLDPAMVHDIFNLNPPVLHVFDKNNTSPWSPFAGITVFIFIWAVFFGNAIALIYSGAIQQGATSAEFDPLLLGIYAGAILFVIVFGSLSIVPPLRAILNTLHGTPFKIGLPRHAMALGVTVLTFSINNSEQLFSLTSQDNDLLGPTYANAIDGETLFMSGLEVSLFGIDAVERDQICQNGNGKNYSCGQIATQALQTLVQDTKVICFPIVNVNERRLLALCELAAADKALPNSPTEFIEGYRPDNLSRLMIVNGHAISIGLGVDVFKDEQDQAQRLREGIWQGSFLPPRLWRSESKAESAR